MSIDICGYLLGSAAFHFSHSVMSNSLRPHGVQHTRPPFHHQLPDFTQTHVHWVSEAIQPSHPLSSPSPPVFNLSQNQGLSNESALCIRWPSIGVSVSTSVFPMNTQEWSSLGWTGRISLQFRRLSKSSPTPQFKSISSLALSFLNSPALTSIHDYWKNHRFDFLMDLWW